MTKLASVPVFIVYISLPRLTTDFALTDFAMEALYACSGLREAKCVHVLSHLSARQIPSLTDWAFRQG